MRNPFLSITLFVTLLAAAPSCLLAQPPQGPQRSPAQAAPAGGVAVIDLAWIFKNHGRFQQMKEMLKQQVDQAEQEMKSLNEQIQRLGEQLQGMQAGSPEYKDQERRMADLQAELNVQMRQRKRDFLLQEAKNYYTVYQEVLDELRYFCERQGITLVMRFNGEKPNQDNPEEVLKELNKSVVYHHQAIDITPIILDQVNRRGSPPTGQTPRVGQQRAGVPPRQ